MGESKDITINQPYKYNGKELDRKNGLDTYDYGARCYRGNGSWDRMDNYCEKYHSFTPYGMCVNNPLIFIDIHGDSLYCNDLEYLQTCLETVFGDYTDYFTTINNNLVYQGSTKGMTREQKKLMNGLEALMYSPIKTSVYFGDKIDIQSTDGVTQHFETKESGGGLSILQEDNPTMFSENIVLVNPSVSQLEVSEFSRNYLRGIYQGPLMNDKTLQTDTIDLLFHEFGHVIVGAVGKYRVIDYNNYERKQRGLPRRGYDNNHYQ